MIKYNDSLGLVFLTLREEHRLRVFANKMLRNVFVRLTGRLQEIGI